MTINDSKKELFSYIENTNDEELLSLLKGDFVFHGKVKDADITDSISKAVVVYTNAALPAALTTTTMG